MEETHTGETQIIKKGESIIDMCTSRLGICTCGAGVEMFTSPQMLREQRKFELEVHPARFLLISLSALQQGPFPKGP